MTRTLPGQLIPRRGGRPDAHLELLVVASPDADRVGDRLSLRVARTIGRGEAADEVVDDGRMSRVHATVGPTEDDGVPRVRDQGSRNGVLVDGRPTLGAPLAAGAVLRLGDTCFVAVRAADPLVLSQDEETAIRGISAVIRDVRRSVARVAPSELTVLVTGETGTGKELVASEVHRQSGRRGRLVALNCAAIPDKLAESVLFGHVRGAFTGATDTRDGVFVQADGGTLFLDEIGELPAGLQSKLLRVLEDWVVTPVGAARGQRVDVRLVAATNVRIREAVAAGDFRGDLLARIEEWPIELPPLRSRRGDICALLFGFLAEDGPRAVAADVAEALLLHDWPFNVRELRKLARRLSIAVDPGQVIGLEHLPPAIVDAQEARRLGRAPTAEVAPSSQEPDGSGAAALTPDIVIAALQRMDGNVTRAARYLGVGRKTLYRRLTEYGIDPTRYRSS